MLIDQRSAHRPVAHPVHQLTRARTAGGRERVPRMSQVVEVKGDREAGLRDELRPADRPMEVIRRGSTSRTPVSRPGQITSTVSARSMSTWSTATMYGPSPNPAPPALANCPGRRSSAPFSLPWIGRFLTDLCQVPRLTLCLGKKSLCPLRRRCPLMLRTGIFGAPVGSVLVQGPAQEPGRGVAWVRPTKPRPQRHQRSGKKRGSFDGSSPTSLIR